MPTIIPIKDLKNTSEISEMCHKTEEPVYITKNGYGDMVIMSMETYEGLSKRLKMYQSLMTSEKQISGNSISLHHGSSAQWQTGNPSGKAAGFCGLSGAAADAYGRSVLDE